MAQESLLKRVSDPAEIIVVDGIPKNKSGKIMRRVLKAWAGRRHLSTLED